MDYHVEINMMDRNLIRKLHVVDGFVASINWVFSYPFGEGFRTWRLGGDTSTLLVEMVHHSLVVVTAYVIIVVVDFGWWSLPAGTSASRSWFITHCLILISL